MKYTQICQKIRPNNPSFTIKCLNHSSYPNKSKKYYLFSMLDYPDKTGKNGLSYYGNVHEDFLEYHSGYFLPSCNYAGEYVQVKVQK